MVEKQWRYVEKGSDTKRQCYVGVSCYVPVEYNYILQLGKNKSYDIRLETRNVVPHTQPESATHLHFTGIYPPNEGLNGFALTSPNEMPCQPSLIL